MFYLLCTLLFIGFAEAAELRCNQTVFIQCQENFAKGLGFDSTYNWEKPAALMAAVQDVYINSNDDLTGLVKVCKEFNKLIKCLNAEKLDVDTCISAKWLLHNQQHVDKAYPYAMLMKQIRWQCSAGFYPAYDNWNCIAKAYRNRNATLISCINSFRTNANHAPEYEICKYAASGKRCYQQAFYETCPDSAAVRNYGCESFRQYVLAEFPQCDDFCEVRVY